MAGYKQKNRNSKNFSIKNGELIAITPEGETFISSSFQEELLIGQWMNSAQECVEEDKELPPRPLLSPLGEEALNLLWP